MFHVLLAGDYPLPSAMAAALPKPQADKMVLMSLPL
jgi:hypothetical protein